MSGSADGSRLATSNPASTDSSPETPESDSAPTAEVERPADLPTVDERVDDVWEKYPDRALVPVSRRHGRALREECVIEEGDGEVRAKPWGWVVKKFLEWHEGYRGAMLKLERGQEGRRVHEEALKPMETAYSSAYGEREFARLKALERETTGGERPTGGQTFSTFARPHVALITLSASSLSAGEQFRPLVDHQREMADAWPAVRRTLRYVLEDAGLDRDDWVYLSQGEPHTGGGLASGYGHQHVAVMFDAGAATSPVTRSTFEPVVAKHVAECSHAGWDAHGPDDAIRVREVGEGGVESVASYVAEYVATSEDDLLERPTEYLMWAAGMWASNTRRMKKSNSAGFAISADKCKQAAESLKYDQTLAHGEEVVRSRRQGHSFECAECGSPWGIPQSGTLAEKRLREPEPTEEAVEDSAEAELASRWRDAEEVAVVGEETRLRECDHPDGANECPLCDSGSPSTGFNVSSEVPIPDDATAPPGEAVSVSFEREPEWRATKVLRGEDEYPVGDGRVKMKRLYFNHGNRRITDWTEGFGQPPPD